MCYEFCRIIGGKMELYDIMFDYPIFISNTIYKARKQHTCDFCSRIIEKNELYMRKVYKEDNKIITDKYCSDCLDDPENILLWAL